jgi:hypothetical protein
LDANFLYQSQSHPELMDISFPLSIILSLSCVAFWRIVRPFFNIGEPDTIVNTVLDPASTLAILQNLGLDFLTYTGPFYTLIMLYLINLDNLTHMLIADLAIMDVGVLQEVLIRLRFLITNHELIFGVLSNIVRMDDAFNLDFDYSIELLEETARSSGNLLYRAYRLIERELNIDNSDLPDHWSEL